ncbi:hypothetical protein [Streptomyces sp. NPDC001450]
MSSSTPNDLLIPETTGPLTDRSGDLPASKVLFSDGWLDSAVAQILHILDRPDPAAVAAGSYADHGHVLLWPTDHPGRAVDVLPAPAGWHPPTWTNTALALDTTITVPLTDSTSPAEMPSNSRTAPRWLPRSAGTAPAAGPIASPGHLRGGRVSRDK